MHYRLFSLIEHSPRCYRGGGLTSTPPPFYKSLQISNLCSHSDLWRIASELTRPENFSTRVPVACAPEYRTIAYEVFYIYDSKFIK